MATVTINPKFIPNVEAMVDLRLKSAVEELEDIARQRVSTQYPPSSMPGESPHRRSGGIQEAIFSERIDVADYAFGVNKVAPDPDRMDANREWLGLWMELGTGHYREPFPPGSSGTTPPVSGEKTSVQSRPYLQPTLNEHGREVVERHLRGGV